jgi:hypothetical protein
MAVQGDYFFLFLLSFVKLTIREINDKVNTENIIINDIASNTLIAPPPFIISEVESHLHIDYLVQIIPLYDRLYNIINSPL